MGHWCKICERVRPNEKFSGKGHKNHICKQCTKRPLEERQAIEQSNEIFGYIGQSHISKKNLSRLQTLSASSHSEIADLAAIALEVGRIKPYKQHRLKYLAKNRQDLLQKLEESGLILAHY